MRKTYEVKPDDPSVLRAAAGGVGLIAVNRPPVGESAGRVVYRRTVGSAQSAAGAGRWRPQVINYREEQSIVERVKEITGGKSPRGL